MNTLACWRIDRLLRPGAERAGTEFVGPALVRLENQAAKPIDESVKCGSWGPKDSAACALGFVVAVRACMKFAGRIWSRFGRRRRRGVRPTPGGLRGGLRDGLNG